MEDTDAGMQLGGLIGMSVTQLVVLQNGECEVRVL